MRSCPVLANITRCSQTRRAPGAPPRTAGLGAGKGCRLCGLPSVPDGADRAGRRRARGPESSSAASVPRRTFFYRGLGGGKEGFRLRPALVSSTPRGRSGLRLNPSYRVAPASKPASGDRGPVRFRSICKPCLVGASRPDFLF